MGLGANLTLTFLSIVFLRFIVVFLADQYIMKQLFGIFDFVFKQHILSLFLSVVDCSYQRIDGSTDDIRVYACTPGKCSVRLLDADIGDRTGFGTLL